MRPFRRVIGLERQEKRDPSAEGVPDDGELAKIALEDELGQKLGLIARRVALVERLVGAAEALEVDGDDLVVAGEVRRDMPPGEGVGAEAVDQQDRRAFAALDRVELDRRVRRPEPGVTVPGLPRWRRAQRRLPRQGPPRAQASLSIASRA